MQHDNNLSRFALSPVAGAYPERHPRAGTAGAVLGCLIACAIATSASPYSLMNSHGVVWPQVAALCAFLVCWWRPTTQSAGTLFLCAFFTQIIITFAVMGGYLSHMGLIRTPLTDNQVVDVVTFFAWLAVPAALFSPHACAVGRWVLLRLNAGGAR